MKRRVALPLLALTLLIVALQGASVVPESPAEARDETEPYGFEGERRESPDGVRYTYYSGKTTSFDGLPLAADVTIPEGVEGPLPLVVMLHGYTQDRTYWQSETAENESPIVDSWNNVSFAERGYAVLNYTARGFGDSCGPDTATDPEDPSTLPAECLSREYWVHLADPQYEVRDAQHLIGKLADQGVIDPGRIAATGQSYGGGQSWLLALQNSRQVGTDGSVRRWESPEEGIPLEIAAAVPKYTWSSLTGALLPNGRSSDRRTGSPDELNDPAGVPIQSYLSALNVGGQVTGFYAPPGRDPSADINAWLTRFSAGDPYVEDPVVQRAFQELDRRSPLYVEPDGEVPVYQISGLTDPLFPPVQAVQMERHVRGELPGYPIKSFYGDIGHDNAGNPRYQWDEAHEAGNAFLDHHILAEGEEPDYDVTALATTCLPGQDRQTFQAQEWSGLAGSERTFSSRAERTTSSAAAGLEGVASDPVGKQGCITVPRDAADPGAAAWEFPARRPFTLAGQPELELRTSVTGNDAQLNVRLWDVAPGGEMTLVSRGTYRHDGPSGTPQDISYQTSANVWEFQRGHRLRVEVTGDDAPYYRPNNQPFAAEVSSMRLSLPLPEE